LHANVGSIEKGKNNYSFVIPESFDGYFLPNIVG